MRRLIVSLISFFITTATTAQISLQSGSATYNIPIFNWQDYLSDIGFSVNLSYNSGQGLRTDDIASNVGQGWNIYAGGAIHRMQVGLPDDQYPSNGFFGGGVADVTKYPAGYLFTTTSQSPDAGCPDKLTRYPIFKHEYQVYKNLNSYEYDRELDYFSFQFNGRTGVFILDKNTQQGIMLGDSRIKISYVLTDMTSSGIRTRISSFKIIDEKGTKYNFNTLSSSVTLETKNYDPYNNNAINYTPSFDAGTINHERGFIDNNRIKNPLVVDGWYLTSIEDGFNGRTVQFNYTHKNLSAVYSGSSISYKASKDNISVSDRYSFISLPVLTSINATDGHLVTFHYASEARADFPGENALSHIDVTLNGRYVSRHSFHTSYLIKNSFSKFPTSEMERKNARLYLNSVVKYSVDLAASDEPYYFDYYKGSSNPGDIVPPPFTLVRDIWGFYNGDNSQDYNGVPINVNNKTYPGYLGLNFSQLQGLCFIRNGSPNTTPVLNPKNGYAKNGLIKTITTPSGESIEYQYEQNETMHGTTKIMCGGVHVSQIKMFDKKNCTTSVPLITNYSYLTDEGDPSLWGFEQPVNKFTSSFFYEPESKYYRWRPWQSILGECNYRFMYPGVQFIDQRNDQSSDKAKIMEIISIVTGTISAIYLIVDIATVINGVASTVVIVGVVVAIVASLIVIFKTCLTPHHEYVNDSSTDIYFNNDLNAVNLLPQQFKQVVVTPGDGSNGKTKYTFTSDDDYPIWEFANPNFTKKQRFASWAYGLPLKTVVSNTSGMIVKEVSNIYSFANAKRSFTTTSTKAYPSCKCVVNKTFSLRSDQWVNNPLNYSTTSTSNMATEIYDVFSGRIELIETIEKEYYGGDYIQTTTSYSYNPINFQPNHIEKQKSDESEISYEDITYSCDYNTGVFNGIYGLNYKNAVNLPVKKVVSVGKKASPSASTYTKYVLGEKVTEYAALSDGSIKPSRVLVKRTNDPVLASSWVGYTSPTAPLPTTFKIAQTFTYNNVSNLVGVKDEGSRTITNIYDYNNRFAVATVVNGGYPYNSSYSSFETNELGGWEIESGSPAYFNGGITGKRSFHLNGSNSLRSMTSGGKYLLSFWSTSSNVVINTGAGAGALTLLKSAPTIDGYTYYEYEFNSTEFIEISGNAKIDELRLYPANARMKTQTFDELLGKTTECDENNRLIYYEYDEYGRMLFVKDDYKNIVKMYEYNQKKGFGSCSVTYYNVEISATFLKDDCPGDTYPAIPFTYTVPANKYSSTIGQLDADAQAWNEITRLGQTTANISGEGCLPYYFNTAISQNFVPDICEPGFKPSPTSVTYTVPARKYKSTISQADADAMAARDMRLNGQYHANITATCVSTTDPEWEVSDPAEERCGTGPLAGHKEVKMYDVNPNSSTYNTFMWVDMGLDPAFCPLSGGRINNKTKVENLGFATQQKPSAKKTTTQIKQSQKQSVDFIKPSIMVKKQRYASVISR